MTLVDFDFSSPASGDRDGSERRGFMRRLSSEMSAQARDLDEANACITIAYDQTLLALGWLLAGFLDSRLGGRVVVGGQRTGTLTDGKGPPEGGTADIDLQEWLLNHRAKLPLNEALVGMKLTPKGATVRLLLTPPSDRVGVYLLPRELSPDDLVTASNAMRDQFALAFKDAKKLNASDASSDSSADDTPKVLQYSASHRALLNNNVFSASHDSGSYAELDDFRDVLSSLINIEYEFTVAPLMTYDRGRRILRGGLFNVHANVHIPDALVRHSTSTPTDSPVSRTLFEVWLQSSLRVWTNQNAGVWPMVMTHPKTNMKALQLAEASYAGFRPRVNAAGWAVLGGSGPFRSGRPFKFGAPRHGKLLVDAIDQLDKLALEADAETDPARKEKLEIERQAKKIALLGGKIALVDWTNDRVLVADNSGEITHAKIDEARPLTDDMLRRYLERHILEDIYLSDINQLCARLHNFERDTEVAARRSTVDRSLPAGARVARDINKLCTAIILYTKQPVKLKHLCGQRLSDFEDDGPEGAALINDLKALQAVFIDLFPKEEEINSRLSDPVRFGVQGFLFETIATMTTQRYTQCDDAQRGVKERMQPMPLPEVLQIPNIEKRPGGIDFVLPHQKSSLELLGNSPERAMLGVDAGGGKTIITLISLLFDIQKSRARRPLVIPPVRLVSSWQSETNAISHGKINAMVLRPAMLERLIKGSQKAGGKGALNTFEAARKWINSFPPNTVFFLALNDPSSSRQLYEDQPDNVPKPNYWNIEGIERQFLQLLCAVGFDYVAIDESQGVKNKETRRYADLARLFARAKYQRLLSGTLVFNTIVDLWGQMALLDPSLTGTLEEFKAQYGIAGSGFSGSITEENRRRMLADLGASISMIKKKRSEWSFLLPRLVSKVVDDLRLTPMQSKFYEKLMVEEVQPILLKWKELQKQAGTDADNEEEDNEALMEQVLARSLQRIDQFVTSPDADSQYPGWTPSPGMRPQGADLVSPKVRAADDIIARHLADPNSGKIMVFGYFRRTSAHFMKHTRHANVAVHYTADSSGSGDEALRRFKEDPNVRVLVADETSIQVGQNLQVASAIIRMETLWSPGGYEQALARIYRPDPRGKYDHKFVQHWWLVCRSAEGEATIDLMKSARFHSKAWGNAQLDYADAADGGRWLRLSSSVPDLEILKLSADMILNFKAADAEQYKDAWIKLEGYQDQSNRDRLRAYATNIKLQNPGVGDLLDADGNVISKQKFLRYIVTDIEPSPVSIAGSKRVYVPWMDGITVPDPLDLGLKTFDDNAENAAAGMYVWTEFGPGIIEEVKTTASDKTKLKVQVAHGSIRIDATRVAYPTKKDGQHRIKTEVMPNVQDHILLPPGVTVTQPFGKRVTMQVIDNPDVRPAQLPPKKTRITTTDEADDAAEPPTKGKKKEVRSVDLIGQVINGMPAMVVPELLPEMEDIEGAGKWVKTVPFISVGFSTYQAADAFIKELVKRFAMTRSTYDELLTGVQNYRFGKRLLADTRPTAQAQRNFFMDTHKKLGISDKTGKPIIKPMWVAFEDAPVICFSQTSHHANVLKWLRTKARSIQGVRKIRETESMWVSFFSKITEARATSRALSAILKQSGNYTVDLPAFDDDIGHMKMLMSQKPVDRGNMRKNEKTEDEDAKPAKKAGKKPVVKGRR